MATVVLAPLNGPQREKPERPGDGPCESGKAARGVYFATSGERDVCSYTRRTSTVRLRRIIDISIFTFTTGSPDSAHRDDFLSRTGNKPLCLPQRLEPPRQRPMLKRGLAIRRYIVRLDVVRFGRRASHAERERSNRVG